MMMDLPSRIDEFRYEKVSCYIDKCQYEATHVSLEGGNL